LYGLREWAERFHPELLNLNNRQIEFLNDDRVGHALEYLFDADRATLLTELVVKAINEFDLNMSQLHNDSTSITLTGNYSNANGDNKRGKKSLKITNGHNKDHRPDLKQLLWILTVTADGAVPVHYKACDGNTTDDTTHIETWTTLGKLIGSADFIYVADCKLCVSDTLTFIAGKHGKFITILPRTRSEEKWFRDYVVTHEIQWAEEWEKEKSRSVRKWKKVEKWRVVKAPVPSVEGFRIIWVWNSTKEKCDQKRRYNSIKTAQELFGQLEGRLQNSRCRIRTREGVVKAADKIIKDTGAGRWVSYSIDEETERIIRQVGKGRPGPDTRYVSKRKVHFHVSCRIDGDLVQHDAHSDGMFPLITNCNDLNCRAVLEKYKYQPRLEKRHQQMKSVYDVTPVLLKSVTRIEGFLFVYFIALLVQALIEREIRMNMKNRGIDSIPIYFEGRECVSPTTDKILSHFNNIELHRLWSGKTLVRTFNTSLSNKQKELLQLAGVPLESHTELG